MAGHHLNHRYGNRILGGRVESIHFTIAIDLYGRELEDFSILVVKFRSPHRSRQF